MHKFKTIHTVVLFFLSQVITAQCAMCKAVVEGGEVDMAEGVNNGITYLMIFPYILVGILFYYIYKNRMKSKV
ncbi:hypothetical protein BSU00_09595 [Tenacibaculum sp. SG-28]|nr:hypothetical protein [Tenacibaculum sp. SG-28]PQJ21220.1 hypothetical protein BSU00_09595 [Tenacibaculum sp. SG-28]